MECVGKDHCHAIYKEMQISSSILKQLPVSNWNMFDPEKHHH